MRLAEIDVEAYRSIANRLTVRVQDEVTCFIGANESGKSNILHTIPFLKDGEFSEFDRNSSSTSSRHPRLTFTVRLNATDRRYLLSALDSDLESLGEPAPDTAEFKTHRAVSGLRKHYAGKRGRLQLQVTGANVRQILFGKGGRIPLPNPRLPEMSKWINTAVPQVVLFEASDDLADKISLANLEARTNLPFEGLLKLAGVWDRRDELFSGDLNAHRLHDVAGKTLTRKLRQKWTQGSRLHFQFHASGNEIAVRIKDPVTFDAPSFRSLGFRSFLSFYLTLFAETEELDPEGFILLFDEPGLHLHPQGQKDLLRELRNLGTKNQVLYATHSPFLIDRNDLPSVLLVTKGTTKKDRGTQITYKPYGDNWRKLTDALGIVPADAFFPPDRTLVVEGSSDRIYLTTFIRLLADELKADLNFLSILDADRRDELPGFVRMLVAAGREVVVAADGDKGGQDFEKYVRRIAGGKRSQIVFLDMRETTNRNAETSIEDLVPVEPWCRAIDEYVAGVLGSEHEVKHDTIMDASATERRVDATGRYLADAQVIEYPSKLSKTTVAHLLAEGDLVVPDRDAPIYRLCQAVVKALKIAR